MKHEKDVFSASSGTPVEAVQSLRWPVLKSAFRCDDHRVVFIRTPRCFLRCLVGASGSEVHSGTCFQSLLPSRTRLESLSSGFKLSLGNIG